MSKTKIKITLGILIILLVFNLAFFLCSKGVFCSLTTSSVYDLNYFNYFLPEKYVWASIIINSLLILISLIYLIFALFLNFLGNSLTSFDLFPENAVGVNSMGIKSKRLRDNFYNFLPTVLCSKEGI